MVRMTLIFPGEAALSALTQPPAAPAAAAEAGDDSLPVAAFDLGVPGAAVVPAAWTAAPPQGLAVWLTTAASLRPEGAPMHAAAEPEPEPKAEREASKVEKPAGKGVPEGDPLGSGFPAQSPDRAAAETMRPAIVQIDAGTIAPTSPLSVTLPADGPQGYRAAAPDRRLDLGERRPAPALPGLADPMGRASLPTPVAVALSAASPAEMAPALASPDVGGAEPAAPVSLSRLASDAPLEAVAPLAPDAPRAAPGATAASLLADRPATAAAPAAASVPPPPPATDDRATPSPAASAAAALPRAMNIVEGTPADPGQMLWQARMGQLGTAETSLPQPEQAAASYATAPDLQTEPGRMAITVRALAAGPALPDKGHDAAARASSATALPGEAPAGPVAASAPAVSSAVLATPGPDLRAPQGAVGATLAADPMPPPGQPSAATRAVPVPAVPPSDEPSAEPPTEAADLVPVGAATRDAAPAIQPASPGDTKAAESAPQAQGLAPATDALAPSVPPGQTQIAAEATAPRGADAPHAPLRRAELAAPPMPVPPALGPQLAEAVARFADSPVELTLAPEELGRVRLTLSTTEAGLVLAVSAERPETLDLMRRNIDQLARDFREIGFAEMSFSFTQQDRRPQADPQAAIAAAPPVAAALTAAPAPQTLHRSAPSGGLDLRI